MSEDPAVSDGQKLVELPFKVHAQVVKDGKRPSTIYQQLSFESPSRLRFVCFRNYYCGAITIKQLVDREDGKKVWQTILHRHSLMKDPHYEDEAQLLHTLAHVQFNSNFRPNEPIQALRFYLYQPSTNWRSFGLRQLTCYDVDVDKAKSSSKKTTIFSAPPRGAAARPAVREAIRGLLASSKPMFSGVRN